MKFKNFVLDVDGVLAKSDVLYSSEGKVMKVFGPDDHDALNMLRERLHIQFVTSDKRGFEISKRRVVDDMKFGLELVSTYKRVDWMAERFKLEETIYMGDGIFDSDIFKKVGYSICPADGFYLTRQQADHVTHSCGGNRAVAEACIHILNKFFNEFELVPNTKHGIWKEGNQP
ncbi:Phosphoglycolate phosphatase [uncultured archaeon]|nr:Phosphoglycolate phosphatase [uncultured archaeon]